MIMCNACFNDEKLQTTTTFTVDCDNCIIVIKNVPCLECKRCGEIIFSDDVSEKLEQIVNAAKKLMLEVSVIDFNKAA